MKRESLAAGVCLVLLCLTTSISSADGPAAAPAPSAAPALGASTNAAGPGRRGQRNGAPASDAEKAEMAKLMDLPVYATGLPDGDYSTAPPYTPAPEQAIRAGAPQGRVIEFSLNSSESKFYPGRNGAPFQRKVSVYVPSQYRAGTPAALIVSCDSYGVSRGRQLPTILDNEIAEHRLPVIVAVMIANGGTAGGERSLEYDTLSGKYAEFVESEVLPRVEKEAGVTLTKDPEARMAYGGSSGGICAFSMAWFHPEIYHRVLSYSGSFANLQRSADFPHGGWEYPDNVSRENPARPLRVWLEVGENDLGATTAASSFRNWVLANERMAAALKAKGYHYQFVYAKGAGHVDEPARDQTVPQALEFLWRGYPLDTAAPSK